MNPPASALVVIPSLRRSLRMVQRNLIVYKHTWMVIFTGFFEPVFYLVGIGLGLGAMVRPIDGTSYAAYVAPGLLASSCMNGAITDGLFNIFFKLHFQKTYEGILATPLRVPDVAFGEMLWALMRGALYAAGFLLVLVGIGMVTGRPMILSPWALLAWPAALLICASFSACAVCATSFLRTIQDFDVVMGLVAMPMFLFSGTFFPVSRIPSAVRWVVEMLPLYHAVALLRQLTTGAVESSLWVHAGYLVLAGLVALVAAMRRLERALVK